jgi:hypothetical protein
MRRATRDKGRFAEATGSARAELSDAIPTGRRSAANRRAEWVWLAMRGLGALAVLATGAVHLHEFDRFYSQIPTIGTLFFLNFLGAAAIGLSLLAPVERIGGRYGSALLVLLALAGIALAAVAFAFLLISEQTPLFGFKEPGYDPTGIAATRAAEVAAVLFLSVFLVGRLGLKAPMLQW